ncbi:hypothetical protein M3P05_10000 [Sansalvadorimonas sp. 2012CJ34-2]|uniref:Uncharacterized protein n=1 Tax=Parendozoicomonas callyspongiae TaxID=2942213 RepID=A0ABT0PID9_9GAMM|nr:hypothetical protein [Sansalvadorimonas sp. 2012CJ34-2]MCL6270253.1 hypothetical protein [Sansalvadorimonas sp. 2012CJ34-2]
MNSKHQIIKHFAEDWGDHSPQYEICLSIVDYLERTNLERLRFMSFKHLKGEVAPNSGDAEFWRSALYLTGASFKILDFGYQMIDELGQAYTLEIEDVRQAKITGELIHPYTGEPVEDYQNHVFIYFFPGTNAQGLV